ncbi:MAG: SufE family protein [Verrucomicrobiaceae bacterium]|nr:SufE family protein [Verrucomicrobiaceae bacterium]
MTLIEQRKQQLRDEYGIFPDPQELFEYLIEKNKKANPLPNEFKTDEYIVKGCVSSLWLVPSFKEGKCYYKSDADSLITRAVASVVCELYSGLTPQEVEMLDPAFLAEVNISTHLSPNRRNGLSQLCAKIKDFAKNK